MPVQQPPIAGQFSCGRPFPKALSMIECKHELANTPTTHAHNSIIWLTLFGLVGPLCCNNMTPADMALPPMQTLLRHHQVIEGAINQSSGIGSRT